MAKIWMDDKVGRDKFDPYKDTLVTTVRGTEEEVKEVLDKLMGDETNKIERISREERRMCLIKKDDVVIAINDAVRDLVNYNWEDPDRMLIRKILHNLRLTVQEMQEIEKSSWISVKERMPSKGEKILLYIPEREGCKQHGMYLGEVEKVEADPKGEHNFWGRPVYGSDWIISGWSYFEEPIVTHWMPLPLCPEQEEDNDD